MRLGRKTFTYFQVSERRLSMLDTEEKYLV